MGEMPFYLAAILAFSCHSFLVTDFRKEKFFCFSVPNHLKESDWVGDQVDLQFWLKVSGLSSPKDILSAHIPPG
jgi:hypothetical protein